MFVYVLYNDVITEKSDVACRKSNMAAVKTEAAITYERLEITTRFQLPPFSIRPDLDMTLSTLPEIARGHWPTTKFKMSPAHSITPLSSYFHFRFRWPPSWISVVVNAGESRQCQMPVGHFRKCEGISWNRGAITCRANAVFTSGFTCRYLEFRLSVNVN